jgi:transcription elongation factor Elf1
MNTLNNASNNNIVSMQLKLFDSNDFIQNLKEKTHTVKKIANQDKRVIMLNTDEYEYLNPFCPFCSSTSIIKEGNRTRIVNLPYKKKHKIYLKKYYCKNCGKFFQTEVESIVKKYKNYSVHFKESTEKLLKMGYVSARKAAKNYAIYWDYSPSHQTIKNMIKKGDTKRIMNSIDVFSGYYSYDEEYLRLNGEKAYRLTLFDTIFNYPVAEEISFDLKSSSIKSFIEEVTLDIPVECIITDHVPKYREILDELNITHQLCLFHFLQMVTRLRKDELKKIKGDEVEEEIILQDCKELKEIFRAPNFKECLNRFIHFINNLTPDKEYLVQFMNKHVIKNFKRMIPHYLDPLIERTTNKNENYYRQTDSDRIKKIYKTSTGILDYLQLKMESWTEKSLAKIN